MHFCVTVRRHYTVTVINEDQVNSILLCHQTSKLSNLYIATLDLPFDLIFVLFVFYIYMTFDWMYPPRLDLQLYSRLRIVILAYDICNALE